MVVFTNIAHVSNEKSDFCRNFNVLSKTGLTRFFKDVSNWLLPKLAKPKAPGETSNFVSNNKFG